MAKIAAFKNDNPESFSYLPMRILNNCILLPIEADNQNTALRIFTTLNDRGMPLSDGDIFKAQFYKSRESAILFRTCATFTVKMLRNFPERGDI